MHPIVEKLAWDTAFFNFTVGRIEALIRHPTDLQRVEAAIAATDTTLSYYSAAEPLPDWVHRSKTLAFGLVDQKTTYAKAVQATANHSPHILPVGPTTNLDKLTDLAIQSGLYSRFNVDKRIGKAKFEALYTAWMHHSIHKTLAKEVLVYQANGEVVGMVTLGEKNSGAHIGLLAVDPSFRGQGVGQMLLQSAEKWAYDRGYADLQVVTQGANVPACRLYERCGYAVTRVDFVYHVWKR